MTEAPSLYEAVFQPHACCLSCSRIGGGGPAPVKPVPPRGLSNRSWKGSSWRRVKWVRWTWRC